jgi:hypothetical protein
MANDVYLVSVGAFDFLDHLIEPLEAVDGVCITGLRDIRKRERVKCYVAALLSGAVQPFLHVGLRGSKSAEENNVDAHLFLTPFSDVSPVSSSD